MSGKILIVDDNRYNRRLLTDILQEANYTVFTAESGLEVMDIVHSVKPDAILLDIMMPKMDGFKVCELLKKDSETKDIPILMVTAKTDTKDLHRAFELGAFDYVKKPIDEIELLARLKSALSYKDYQDMLKAMATRDLLTGLYNHAILLELLQKEIVKQDRQHENVCFVMMDIDYFKKINDTYGHTSGDIILKELADIIVKQVRASDIVGRYGGEEFSIILTGLELNDAISLCERMRLKIQNHDFNLGDKSIRITLSMGLYFKVPQDETKLGDIVKKADEALYQAKNSGRNKVELYVAKNNTED